MQTTPVRVLVLALALLPTTAFAHSGESAGHAFADGFAHPLGGLDHVLAMVTVGLLAWQIGGRSLFLLPATFLVLMGFGGLLGIAGTGLPGMELGLALSVVVLGAVAAGGAKAPLPLALALVGALATLHGHAHGVEMPLGAAAVTYAAGFLMATAVLHASGIAAGSLIARLAGAPGNSACRLAGAGVTVAGIALVVQLM